MPSFCGCIDSARGSQRRKSDRHPNSADSQYRRTQALQQGKDALVQPMVRICLTLGKGLSGFASARVRSLVLHPDSQWKAPVTGKMEAISIPANFSLSQHMPVTNPMSSLARS